MKVNLNLSSYGNNINHTCKLLIAEKIGVQRILMVLNLIVVHWNGGHLIFVHLSLQSFENV